MAAEDTAAATVAEAAAAATVAGAVTAPDDTVARSGDLAVVVAVAGTAAAPLAYHRPQATPSHHHTTQATPSTQASSHLAHSGSTSRRSATIATASRKTATVLTQQDAVTSQALLMEVTPTVEVVSSVVCSTAFSVTAQHALSTFSAASAHPVPSPAALSQTAGTATPSSTSRASAHQSPSKFRGHRRQSCTAPRGRRCGMSRVALNYTRWRRDRFLSNSGIARPRRAAASFASSIHLVALRLLGFAKGGAL